ncbi:MAG: cupin domain-containing protein, partial [Janthinobacterium lividum]
MQPDLELVQVRDDQSFKIWSHGYPFRTVRWHFHPEYELHLVTATAGNRYVGDHIGPFAAGDLVLVGPNLPHNWISDVPAGEAIEERCLVLQFTASFIAGALAVFPELRSLKPLLAESFRGVRFAPALCGRVGPLMREMLGAAGPRRVT